MAIYIDNPNDLSKRPAGAVLISPMPDGRYRVYMPDDEDLPAFVPEIGAPPAATVTAQEFRDRFTDAELVAMLSSADAGVKLLVLKVQTADPFTMDKPSVQQGLDYLVIKGIITADRRAIIGALT